MDDLDNPSVIYEVAELESRAVTAGMTTPLRTAAPGHRSQPSSTPQQMTWSQTEKDRISKLHVALSVTRAIYYAAMELDVGLTLSQVQRRWLTEKMIKAALVRHKAFIEGLMVRERLSEGFIRKTLVFERDLHIQTVQRILVRKLSIAALSTGVSIMERGECVWFGPYSEAMAAFECFDS